MKTLLFLLLCLSFPRDSDPKTLQYVQGYFSVPPCFRGSQEVSLKTLPRKDLLDLIEKIYGKAERRRNVGIGVIALYVDPPDEPKDLRTSGGGIFFADDIDPKTVPTTFHHEWGHYVECELCSEKERQRWRLLWQEDSDLDMLPSDYAYTNEREGFAESFESFLDQKPLDPEIYRYMTDLQKRLSKC